MEDLTNNLLLVKPSKALEKEILEYKQEYFDFGETRVNGSCGGILTSENIYEGVMQQHYCINLS